MPSAKRTPEADHIAIGIAREPLPSAIVLVPWADDIDPGLSPVLCDPVGILTMDVENAVTSCFALGRLREMDREVTVSMREGVGVVVKGHIKPGTAEPGNGCWHVGHLEDRLEAGDKPSVRDELELAISLAI